MPSFNKFQVYVSDLANKQYDILGTAGSGADVLKVYLSNATPNASTMLVKADLAEIATGNGYSGAVTTANVGTASAGTVTVTGTNVTITASGGSIATFRYVVLYNDTHASKPLIGWWDYGSALTLADTESFQIKFNNGSSSGTMQTLT